MGEQAFYASPAPAAYAGRWTARFHIKLDPMIHVFKEDFNYETVTLSRFSWSCHAGFCTIPAFTDLFPDSRHTCQISIPAAVSTAKSASIFNTNAIPNAGNRTHRTNTSSH
jgi:hypothetical protein